MMYVLYLEKLPHWQKEKLKQSYDYTFSVWYLNWLKQFMPPPYIPDSLFLQVWLLGKLSEGKEPAKKCLVKN